MFRAFIVDDEFPAREVISKLCARKGIEVLGAAARVDEAVSKIRALNPELVFLDIELADGLGFEILEALSTHEFLPVFVSAYDHYALRALKARAMDYLLKPVEELEFNQMADRLWEQFSREKQIRHLHGTPPNPKIGLPSGNETIFVELDQISFVKADGNYSTVQMENGAKYVVCKILKEFESVLGRNPKFLKTHRSYIVNVDHVVSLQRVGGGSVILKTGDRVPISKKEKQIVQSFFASRFESL